MNISIYDVLYDLKVIDEQIRELTKRKLKKPNLLFETRQKLTEVEAKLKIKSEQLETENKKKKQLTDIIADETEKLQKAEIKLNSVKNSKEYQAALKEVSQIKKTVTNLQEQEKARLEALSSIEKEFEQIESEFKNMSRGHESVLVGIKDDINIIDRELNDAKEHKAKILRDIPEELKARYVKVYENKGGIGISMVRDNKCSVCNLSLPRQLCNDILKGEKIHHCPSCQRVIIYINKE
ncbi:MAG: C4-type zinc ribbon domain-containing protein [Proteobacteria bacterium]|nr:C4-type zinc ribbon domain-containing protein [Pseudomonadota bacterium]